MKLLGWWLFGGGLVLAILSFFVPNTVDTPQTTYLASLGETITTGTAAVFNLARAQLQMMLLHAGCAAFVAGAVLLGAGTIAERLDPTRDSVSGVAATSPDVGVAAVAVPSVPEQLELTPEDEEAQRLKTRNDTLMLVGGVIAVILIVLAFAATQPSPAQQAAAASAAATRAVSTSSENTAEGLADKIEAEANR